MMQRMGETTAIQPRRTSRIPLIAVLCGAVVTVLLGVNDRRHPGGAEPIKLGFESVIQMKTALTLGIGVLLLVQLTLALWMYGKLGLSGAPRWVGPTHRVIGLVAVLVSLPVAYNCLLALGIQTYEPRVLVHALLGCA